MQLQSVECEEGQALQPEETVAHMTNNFATLVLATVLCPGWSRAWAGALLSLIVTDASRCGLLRLLAVKGGPACDEECAFVILLLRALGFQTRGPERFRGGSPTNFIIEYRLSRSGARDYLVSLWQYRSVEKVSSPVGMCRLFCPYKFRSSAPDLARIAVVSCAEKFAAGQRLDEEGKSVNDRLNEHLNKALNVAWWHARRKGYRPGTKASKAEEDAYFDEVAVALVQ